MNVRPARPDDAPATARAFIDGFRAGHRGQMPARLIATRTHAASERGWRRNVAELAGSAGPDRCPSVAEDPEDGVVGVARGRPRLRRPADAARTARPSGERCAPGVHPRHRRRGFGPALLDAAPVWLAARGRRRRLVGVLAADVLAADAPARRLCGAAGGRLLGQRVFEDEGVPLVEAVYAWDELPLAGATGG